MRRGAPYVLRAVTAFGLTAPAFVVVWVIYIQGSGYRVCIFLEPVQNLAGYIENVLPCRAKPAAGDWNSSSEGRESWVGGVQCRLRDEIPIFQLLAALAPARSRYASNACPTGRGGISAVYRASVH